MNLLHPAEQSTTSRTPDTISHLSQMPSSEATAHGTDVIWRYHDSSRAGLFGLAILHCVQKTNLASRVSSSSRGMTVRSNGRIGAAVVAASRKASSKEKGTKRISRTNPKLLPRSAKDWMSPLPSNSSPWTLLFWLVAGSHFSSNSSTYLAANAPYSPRPRRFVAFNCGVNTTSGARMNTTKPATKAAILNLKDDRSWP